MRKALVTGSNGFVGSYLVKELIDQGYTVYGVDIKTNPREDFTDFNKIRTIIDYFRPDYIFHLGALAYVPESFIDPHRAINVNITGSLNILEAVRQIGLKTRIQLCGSSEEYGEANDNGYVLETTNPIPLSPYAIAKLAMDHFGQLYAKSYGMNIVVTRTFNHTGPGRGEQYAESAWAKQIVEIEQGKRQNLLHGRLDTVRNYTDARDIVKAYIKAIELPSDIYNICSGRNIEMLEVLNILRSKSEVTIPIQLDPQLVRPADFSFSIPSCEKFKKLTDWQPEIELEQTLEDILSKWREDYVV